MKRVLVVDDQPSLRRLIDMVLSEAGFEVELAEGGVQALERIGAAPPQACVLDVMMPHVDGWEVLRRIRADRVTADLPVVLLTAKGEAGDRLRGWELGCDAYIAKPFDPPDVVQELMAVLTREPAERAALRERQASVVRGMLEATGGRGLRRIG